MQPFIIDIFFFFKENVLHFPNAQLLIALQDIVWININFNYRKMNTERKRSDRLANIN